MTLKQRHRTAEITTNDTKMGRNCDSDNENTVVIYRQRYGLLLNAQNNRFWNSGLKGPHEKAIRCLDRQLSVIDVNLIAFQLYLKKMKQHSSSRAIRDRSFFTRKGGLVGFGGGHAKKKKRLKRGGHPPLKKRREGGVPSSLGVKMSSLPLSMTRKKLRGQQRHALEDP